MKKTAKILLLILAVIIAISIAFTCYYLIVTGSAKLDENKLVNPKDGITFFDINDEQVFKESKDIEFTKFSDLPKDLINAFVSIEDKRFYSHNGIDFKAILRAGIKNLISLSFKEGGSTISQQLIKNTHFTGEKTIKRKLSEIKLAKKLEKKFSKDEIMEKYLNTIYFGSNCFGVTKASKKYFNKNPNELTLSECATLAGLVKSPSNYSPLSNKDKCITRRNVVLNEMLNDGYISNDAYTYAKNSDILTQNHDDNDRQSYFEEVKNELDFLSNERGFNVNRIKVYTNFDADLQQSLKNVYTDQINSDAIAVITDKFSNVLAFESTCGLLKRQLGSTIKPILVYAPSIDDNQIDECSFILDEETNFNGYSPKNYANKYYGEISVKDALAKSLNVPTIKILNSLGVEKAKKYLSKTNIKLNENDNGLNVGLGITENGYTLTDLASVYASFINQGFYNTPSFISKIVNENGKVIYQKKNENVKLYGEDTAYIMNDMLKETVNNGTAKKLSILNFDVCAKTGTVGNEKGNTDVYCVSYNGDITLSVWFGNDNSEYLSNKILGGNFPTEACYRIYSEIYENKSPTNLFETDMVKKVELDKISFENKIIEKADTIAPKRYVIETIFKKTRVPNAVSTRFSSPMIENVNISANNKQIQIELCQAEYINSVIYRENNGIKERIYDTKDNEFNDLIIDNDFKENTKYFYSLTPYYVHDGKIYYGKEVFIGEIKTPAKNAGEISNWWVDDF